VTLTETRATFDAADALASRGVTLELGGHKASTLASADLIVTSPGVPVEQPVFDAARARDIEIIGELELAWRWLKGRVIAITGTKGKSTTTTLVGRMLNAAGRRALVGGNIGVPLSAQVDDSTPETVHVVETSSFQLETTTTFRPWISVWLNFAADHLDRHPSQEAYAAAKARIFANQTSGDWAVVNADDAEVIRRAASARSRQVHYSLAGSIRDGFIVSGDWIVRRTTSQKSEVRSQKSSEEQLIPLSAVELTGRHMLNNVLAAAAASHVAGVPANAMVDGLKGFHGLEHVMEPVATIDGVRFVNDSKATNIEAALRSIESFEHGVVVLLGGKFKGGDFRDLRDALAERGRAVVAIGEAAPLVREALADVLPVVTAMSMREAVQSGFKAAQPDGVVLLAPACASFDWFRDYAERGNVFKEEVKRLTDYGRRTTERREG